MTSPLKKQFNRQYKKHLQHLNLKGLQPKTIEAYSYAVQRIGEHFEYDIEDLSKQQLLDYFSALLSSHSWSTVKRDLYGLKFYYTHVLEKKWVDVDLINPPKSQKLPNIITVQQAQHLFMSTRKLSYRVFFFTLYSMGLRLGEGLRLQVGDIDTTRSRVHIRDTKGNKDRLVPLPDTTRDILRRFWSIHRNPNLLFPNRKAGLSGAATATSALDRGGVQQTLRKVALECGIKKTFLRTA